MGKIAKNKKYLLIILGVLGIFVLFSIGAYVIFYSKKSNPDQVFRNYIEWGLKQNQFAFEQKAEGTGTQTTGTAKNDISKKSYTVLSTSKCEGTNTQIEGNSKINISSTVSVIGTKTYIKINSIDGLIKVNGENKQLATVFQNAKNKWYEVESDNKGVSSLLENGLAAYDTIVLAPTYNTKELANSLIDNKVFSYTDFKNKDNKYTFNFVSDKNAYEKFLKNNFPNLKNQDIILENIFQEKSQIISDLVVDENGQFVGQVLQTTNLCPTIMETFVGQGISGLSSELRNDVRYLEYTTVSDNTIDSSEPISKLFDGLSL